MVPTFGLAPTKRCGFPSELWTISVRCSLRALGTACPTAYAAWSFWASFKTNRWGRPGLLLSLPQEEKSQTATSRAPCKMSGCCVVSLIVWFVVFFF